MNFKSYFYFIIAESLETRMTFLLNKYKNETEQSINQISLADPTSEKKYIDWILNLKTKNSVRFPEDANKIKDTLTKFMNLSKKGKWEGSKNINDYKTYGELSQTIKDQEDVTTMQPIPKEQGGQHYEGMDKIKELGDLSLWRITDLETIVHLAKDTEWCVREESYAKEYLKKGPLYIIIQTVAGKHWSNLAGDYEEPDREEPYVLIHFETAQIKNVLDDPINKKLAQEIYPLIQNAFKQFKFNYKEGIGDFSVFLNHSIAKGKDLEVLNKYNAPHAAYNELTKHIGTEKGGTEKENQDYFHKLIDNISLCPRLLVRVSSNYILAKYKGYVVNKILESKDKETILSYGQQLRLNNYPSKFNEYYALNVLMDAYYHMTERNQNKLKEITQYLHNNNLNIDPYQLYKELIKAHADRQNFNEYEFDSYMRKYGKLNKELTSFMLSIDGEKDTRYYPPWFEYNGAFDTVQRTIFDTVQKQLKEKDLK